MFPTIAQVRAVWQREDGTTETGNNNVKYNTWYYGHPVDGPQYPWCDVAVSWVFIVGCGADPSILHGGAKGSAGCSVTRSGFQRAGQWGTTPRVGALAIFGNDAHIGWVDELDVRNGVVVGFWYWSGNTGQSSYNNGGGVHRAYVSMSSPPDGRVGFCYPTYADSSTGDDLTPEEKQKLWDRLDTMAKAISDIQGRMANRDEPEFDNIQAIAARIEQTVKQMAAAQGVDPQALGVAVVSALRDQLKK